MPRLSWSVRNGSELAHQGLVHLPRHPVDGMLLAEETGAPPALDSRRYHPVTHVEGTAEPGRHE
jgi:hypothetical protein